MRAGAHKDLTVGVAGLGAIGMPVARRLDRGIPGLRLVAVTVRDRAKAEAGMADFTAPVPVVGPDELAERADVVVECVPAAVWDAVADRAVELGRVFVPATVGRLLSRIDLIERAHATGAQILVPSGAILGLDALRATAEGTLRSVTIETRKPPAGLAGAPHLERNGISVADLTVPMCVFSGSAQAGVAGFPANVNVAAAVSLAGLGPARTRLEIWADPHVTSNQHTVRVEADSARLTMTIENTPSAENPRTGRITPLSVIATLRGLTAPIKVGT